MGLETKEFEVEAIPQVAIGGRAWHPANDHPAGRSNGQTAGKSQGSSTDTSNGESRSSLSQLESTVADVRQLTATLAAAQRQADSSDQKAQVLTETTARLRRRLVRLVKLVKHVSHFAFHDELTGLPNRALLLDRLRQATALALRDQKRVALLMIDLDAFKRVNDTYGHGTGDNLLQHVAWLLNTCVRGSDTVCRYGGDEFVIMLPEIDGIDCALAVVKKIHARLAASCFVEGGLIPVTASIGVAIFPDDGLQDDVLVRRADMRMYQEKVAGSHSANRPGTQPPHSTAYPAVSPAAQIASANSSVIHSSR